MPRHGLPNAIAKNESDDHGYQKLHFLCPARAKERARRLLGFKTSLALTTALLGARIPERSPENNVCSVDPFLFSQSGWNPPISAACCGVCVHSCGNGTNYSEMSQQTFMSFD
jgi:hypothetical protein